MRYPILAARRVKYATWLATGMLAALLGTKAIAHAQPAGNEMCGDGTTFTVNLPGILGSLPDSVTVPNGCDIYALFVSGYGINPKMDQLTFYKLAKFVAENNGYVHYSWWNNLTGEYLSRPLHAPDSHPGSLQDTHILGFIPRNFLRVTTVLAKAEPEEDFQFQVDAKLFLKAIRANNPNAIIIVAGHSMGGNAVARLGATSDVPIDLLAPIDPVGNRSRPVGQLPPVGLLTQTFNWNRWRVANDLLGYRQRDCVRNSLGLCRDFDPRLFHVRFACTVGPLLSAPPPPGFGSRAPLVCPQLLPIVVSSRPVIGANVRFLYHRWQKEFTFPFDFTADERLTRPGPLTGLLGGNYQVPVFKNGVGERERNQTCGLAGTLDLGFLAIQALGTTFLLPGVGVQPQAPRDPNIFCSPLDGHGEIAGIYTPGGVITPYAVEANDDWPCSTAIIPLADLSLNCDTDPSKDEQDRRMLRRQKLIEMVTAPAPDPSKTIVNLPNWAHEPKNPNLDMVVDDMIAIVQHLLSQQDVGVDVIPPVTVSSANPPANPNGWNNDVVVVDLSATDTGGSGVKEIGTSLTGAQLGGMLTPGSTAQETIPAEGTTTISYFARDNAGNVESAKGLTVNLDKTPPSIEAAASPAPNAFGWNNSDVTVTFSASDALSGLAEVAPTEPVLVTTEAADQEIIGTATDFADNQSSAAAVVSLDKTTPELTGAPERAADANGWYNSPLEIHWTCTDALSGIDACSPMATYGGPDSASAIVPGSAADKAGNSASESFSFRFDGTAPTIALHTPPDGAVYLMNQAIPSSYGCDDNLSGVGACAGSVVNGANVDTATVGRKEFRVNASDVAGNTASRAHGYDVHYVFAGFFQPVDNLPVVNVANAGRNVPVKWRLTDASGAVIADPGSFVSLVSVPETCDAAPSVIHAEKAEALDATVLKFTGEGWHYNWKTSRGWSGCRLLQLTLSDGTQHSAKFMFR